MLICPPNVAVPRTVPYTSKRASRSAGLGLGATLKSKPKPEKARLRGRKPVLQAEKLTLRDVRRKVRSRRPATEHDTLCELSVNRVMLCGGSSRSNFPADITQSTEYETLLLSLQAV
ncbi:hypothetical protein B0H13DRAFT_1870393 [Mycena leptocephala]|nr:hypothetical protein B0H13DRAFT_1870393 [Mycena leptocephala]